MSASLAQWLCRSSERLFTASGGLGIHTATPLQRAILRTLDGTPMGELEQDPTVARAFGGIVRESPFECTIFSGQRGGKTAMAVAVALSCSQLVDCTPMMRHEGFRIPLVSLSKDLAAQAFSHLKGAVLSSDVLRSLLIGEPTTDSLTVRHPSGRPCEIKVTAGARAGSSVAARYLGAVIFDEFPRMLGASEGVVNWDHMRGECLGRILDGGKILNIGSPWAPFGPAYQQYVSHWGKPSKRVCVIKAPAYDLNPHWWTPERCAEYRDAYPNEYLTNVEAEFAEQDESLLSILQIDQATRDRPIDLPWSPHNQYAIGIDPGTRSNAWTLVVVTRNQSGTKSVAHCTQWIGTRVAPLSPSAVMKEVSEIARRYRVHTLFSDQHLDDALRDMARDNGLALVPVRWGHEERVHRFLELRHHIAERRLELAPDPVLRADLLRIRKRVTQSGLAIDLPQTPDGRHCDYAPALLCALRPWLDGPTQELPQAGTAEWAQREAKRIDEAMERERIAAQRRARGFDEYA